MNDSQHAPTPAVGAGRLKRRGLVAGVVALIGGLLAKASTRSVEAGHTPATGTPGADSIALHIDQTNSATGTTILNRSNTVQAGNALRVTNNNGNAISALTTSTTPTHYAIRADSASTDAVWAKSTTANGVYGESQSSNGVYGESVTGSGVWGYSDEYYGVYGISPNNYGNYGWSGTSAGILGYSDSFIGVLGLIKQDGVGVVGIFPSNTGVYGTSTNSYGVYGISTNSIGLGGHSNAYIGIQVTSNTGTALYASSSGYAGYFVGSVAVQGNFTVFGGAKSAAVRHPDGSHRRLYAVEAPESWFEDFGKGQLANGRASVQLDRDFAAVVHADDYHVFLTAEGDSKGLYVTGKSATGFEVREQQGGTSSLSFSYRIVAKRKDIPGVRLERVPEPPRRASPAAPNVQVQTPPPPPPRPRRPGNTPPRPS